MDYKIPELPYVNVLIFSKPATPGLDFSGTVVSSRDSNLQPGQQVFGATAIPNFGALAEYVVVGKGFCVPVPNGVSLKEAACIGIAGLTAYQSIAPFVKAGDKVFINGGSGGTGTYGIQIAKALGCQVSVSCSGKNAELCSTLGADKVFDYRSEDVVQALKRSGTQYDLIVDNVFDSGKLYWDSHNYMKEQGMFVTIAGTPKLRFITDTIKIMLWPRILGGGQRPFSFVTWVPNVEQLLKVAAWVAEGKVKASIEQVYDLEDAGAAYAQLKTGRTRGKLVIKVAGE